MIMIMISFLISRDLLFREGESLFSGILDGLTSVFYLFIELMLFGALCMLALGLGFRNILLNKTDPPLFSRNLFPS